MTDFAPPPTAQKAVLDELRARILSGSLTPGSALRQEELASQLAVSRVPVREALRMLEAEGHVTYAPHRGYRVVELRLGDLEEIYHLRGLIEDDLVRRALATRSDDHVRAVRLAFEDLGRVEATSDPEPVVLSVANRRFHWAILRPTLRTGRILATLWDSSEAYRARWFAQAQNVTRGAHQHVRAMAAFEAGDAEGLVAVLAEHRREAITALRTGLSP